MGTRSVSLGWVDGAQSCCFVLFSALLVYLDRTCTLLRSRVFLCDLYTYTALALCTTAVGFPFVICILTPHLHFAPQSASPFLLRHHHLHPVTSSSSVPVHSLLCCPGHLYPFLFSGGGGLSPCGRWRSPCGASVAVWSGASVAPVWSRVAWRGGFVWPGAWEDPPVEHSSWCGGRRRFRLGFGGGDPRRVGYTPTSRA